VLKKVIVVSAVLAASFLMLVPAGTATTQPAVQVTIKVSVTDTTLKLSLHSARRGWGAHFVVRNLGHKPHVFEIGGLKSKVIPPGGKATVSASLDERGKFPYSVVLNAAGSAHRGVFTVF
jgi:hypothetical protein